MKTYIRTIRKFWYVVRHCGDAWRLLEDDSRRNIQAEGLSATLRARGALGRGVLSASATLHIGQAIKLANQYGVRLETGTCAGDCRAVLEKDKWLHPIAPGADPWSYSLFTLKRPDEVEVIEAMSRWPEIAIAQCVVNAKNAGVI